MKWVCTKVPQVLLLGNGINLAYEGISWNRLLAKLSIGFSEDDVKAMKILELLKTILVTGNHFVRENEARSRFLRFKWFSNLQRVHESAAA